MDLKKTCRNVFAVVTVLIFILTNEPVMGHILCTDDSVAKAANSTLHIHDEIEAHKFFHKESSTRKKYLVQVSSMVV